MLSDLIKGSLAAFTTNPTAFIIALMAGLIGGYFLSRLRHAGSIDAQDKLLKLKDQVINDLSQKDKEKISFLEVIEKSQSILKTIEGHLSNSSPPPQSSMPLERLSVSEGVRTFIGANSKIIEDLNERIRQVILNKKFKFVFNPLSKGSKAITFLPNGEIGEGRNNNEHKWQIVEGRLEILDSANKIYSRFVLLADGRSFHHTNDPDTLSLRGQYILID